MLRTSYCRTPKTVLSGRISSLDGIRGFSALIVFFVHFNGLFSHYIAPYESLRNWSGYMGTLGHAGVDVFFALSGFLIYGIVLHKRPHYSAFLKRRVSRIYPVFAAVLVFYLAISLMFPRSSRLPVDFVSACWYVAANALLLPGLLDVRPIITVAWSLSYEMYFYILMPVAVTLTRFRLWPWYLRSGCIAGLSAIHLGLYAADINNHPRLVMFGAGMLLQETVSAGILKTSLGSSIVSMALFLGTLSLIAARGTITTLPSQGSVVLLPPLLIILLFVSTYGLLAHAIAPGNLVDRIMCLAPLRHMGTISYSYYLVHGASLNGIALAMRSVSVSSVLSPLLYGVLAVASLGVTVAAGAVVYYYIERPCSASQWARKGAVQKRSLIPRGCLTDS